MVAVSYAQKVEPNPPHGLSWNMTQDQAEKTLRDQNMNEIVEQSEKDLKDDLLMRNLIPEFNDIKYETIAMNSTGNNLNVVKYITYQVGNSQKQFYNLVLTREYLTNKYNGTVLLDLLDSNTSEDMMKNREVFRMKGKDTDISLFSEFANDQYRMIVKYAEVMKEVDK